MWAGYALRVNVHDKEQLYPMSHVLIFFYSVLMFSRFNFNPFIAVSSVGQWTHRTLASGLRR